jgi:hypothetical protein
MSAQKAGKDNLWRVVENWLARNSVFPAVILSSDTVAVNSDYRILFFFRFQSSLLKFYSQSYLVITLFNAIHFHKSTNHCSKLFTEWWEQ